VSSVLPAGWSYCAVEVGPSGLLVAVAGPGGTRLQSECRLSHRAIAGAALQLAARAWADPGPWLVPETGELPADVAGDQSTRWS
jgi:hypothetical protein